ncbi:SET methyltransferase domain containing protein [Nitzschia inconspicua]|uniref:SET methyltransferase domain containing protein n=1 Tax=Nitzschia inconspicua TaxID=303405 RepID=A0A9K3LTC6_9STRA|nr:SET methyltransferase domain containing protein [Nitzschia inconspicua]
MMTIFTVPAVALFLFLLASQYYVSCSSEISRKADVDAHNTTKATTTNKSKINQSEESATGSGETTTTPIATPKRGKCDIYFAPSTIPGAGMGMFAGDRAFSKGEFLADGDLIIPSYDMTWHVGHQNYHFLWEEYTWKASSFEGMKEEVEHVKNVKACSPGFGSAVNCNLPLVNVKDNFESRTVSMSGVNGSVSPGAGAFTIYHGRRWKAKMDIPAGMELYGNYGSGYFRSRPEYGPVPFIANYKIVDKLLTKYRRIITIYGFKPDLIAPDWRLGLLDLLQNMTAIWDDSRTMNAIPQTKDLSAIDWLLENGRGSGFQHYNTSIRSVEWLRENGRCMTNIYDGISRIPHAGRGAFASTFIAKGEIVAPAPLIHIPNRDVFTLYAEKISNVEKTKGNVAKNIVPDHSRPIHQQLLLNYCFGHRESSLLLCPYGLLTSHINHDGKNPNTRIQWAQDEHMAYPEWREQSIDSWGSQEKAGLSFDFVALRDIEPHEEITIDYGHEWSIAWQNHVKYFRKPQNYTPAFELNERIDMVLPTKDELHFESVGVRLFCHEDHLRWAGVLHIIEKNMKEAKEEDWHENPVFPCRIIHRTKSQSSGQSYVVEIFERAKRKSYDWDGRSKWFPMNQEVFLVVAFDLPREVFYFADEVYQRPHHRPWSFRHDMRIPDDIFPEAWKNRKMKRSQYKYTR